MAKILVVDDSAMSRRVLRHILEEGGHQVHEADSGLVALERYFLERYDLVFLDLTMSGMHGLEVLARLREMDAGARVIVATADIQQSSFQLARQAGAVGYVTKPFHGDQIRDVVDSILSEVGHGTAG